MIIMYGTFFIYGFQVLRGVLEEKTQPHRRGHRRLGSADGADGRQDRGHRAVGLTQYFVWSLVAMNLSLPGIATIFAAGACGRRPEDPDPMIGYFMLFFMLGYFLYASVYTAIARALQYRPGGAAAGDDPDVLIVSGVAGLSRPS